MEKLTWPISKELLGREVKYLGSSRETLFDFTISKTYTIEPIEYPKCVVSCFSVFNLKPVMYGPVDSEGIMPWNQGSMVFELLTEEG